MSNTFTWCKIKWLKSQPWGQVHDNEKARADCWYDPERVIINNRDELILEIKENPRIFNINGINTMVRYGVGLITSQQYFGYGIYQVDAKLPTGTGLWPAFWLYEKDRCIPEIDIFEAYSKDNNYHGCFLQPWDIQSCFHSEPGLFLKKIPACRPWFWQFNTDPASTFNSYTMQWNPQRIDFFINGSLVRSITDKSIMQYLEGRKMMVILNTHIEYSYLKKYQSDPFLPFIIRSFHYIPIYK